MSVPRWQTIIEHALSKHEKQTVIQIATLDLSPHGAPTPRVRSQIFRSFWSSPETPSLPLLVTSTDIRTPKVTQLTTSSSKSEVVWWIEGTQQQFRILADIYIVPEPQHHLYDCFKQALIKAAAAADGGRASSGLASLKREDWEKKRQELFRSMSAYMKANWCRLNTPGTKLEGGSQETWPEAIYDPDDHDHENNNNESEKARALWDTALGNFAMMLIDPIEIDFCDLGVRPNVRLLFRKQVLDEGGVDWVADEIVP